MMDESLGHLFSLYSYIHRPKQSNCVAKQYSILEKIIWHNQSFIQ